jgi:glutaconate CoA-transferase subunit B
VKEELEMTEYSQDYTPSELIAVALAREMKDGEKMYLGAATPVGVAATQLARVTHAPNLVCIYGIWIDPDPYTDYFTVMTDASGFQNFRANATTNLSELHDLWMRGEIDFGIIRPAQIDQYGNINNSVLGEYNKPKLRFPGGVAIADATHLCKRILVYVPRHEARVFVKKVDFITGPGHLDEGKWRRKMNIVGKGPSKVVTDMAVMGFDESTGRMKLESIHPGASIEDIEKNTSFPLIVPKKIPETERPSVEQIQLIREKIDPASMRDLDYRQR